MRARFSKLFSLPPPEERRYPLWANHLIAAKDDRDSSYILYLTLRMTFYVALFLALLNVLSLALGVSLNLVLFTINASGSDYVSSFLLSYPKYTSTIVLALVLPYYLVLFNAHVKPTSRMVERSRPIAAAASVIIVLIAMYGAFGVFMQLMEANQLEHSFVYFLICVATMPMVMALGNASMVFLVTSIWVARKKNPVRPDERV